MTFEFQTKHTSILHIISSQTTTQIKVSTGTPEAVLWLMSSLGVIGGAPQGQLCTKPPLYTHCSLFTWQTPWYLADPPHHPGRHFPPLWRLHSHCEGFISKIRPGRLERSTWDSTFFCPLLCKEMITMRGGFPELYSGFREWFFINFLSFLNYFREKLVYSELTK